MKAKTDNDAIIQRAVDALNNWLRTYADDQFDPETVAKAWTEITEGGGTIGYITRVRTDLESLIPAPPTAQAPVGAEEAGR